MSLVGAHVATVRVTGFQKKQKSYVYTIEVAWSDKMAFEIYRRYADFFSFQNSLLQKFPIEAGKGDSGKRIIPSLPSADHLLSIIGRTNTKRLMKSRLKKINNYCQALIQLSPQISHSELITDFFRPVPGDTQLQLKKLKKGLSLYPMNKPAEFDEFVLVDDYIPEEEDRKQHLLAKAGEVVKVLQQKESGWWLVYKSAKDGKDQIGWVPESYLKPYEAEHIEDYLETCSIFNGVEICSNPNDSSGSERTDTPTTSSEKESASITGDDSSEQDNATIYRAIADYYTDDKSQVNFPKGARIFVIDKDEDGWWFVCYNRVEGWAPSSFLEKESSSCVGQSVSTADDEHSECPIGSSQDEQPEVFYATVDYRANKADEVSFLKGEKVEVLKKSQLGWWTIRLLQGQTGLAPATFLTDQPPPAANCTGEIKRNARLRKRVSNISLPPPRRCNILADLGEKDEYGSKSNATQNPTHEKQMESVASSNDNLSPSDSLGSFPVIVEDTKSNHGMSTTNPKQSYLSAEMHSTQRDGTRLHQRGSSPRLTRKNAVHVHKSKQNTVEERVEGKNTNGLHQLSVEAETVTVNGTMSTGISNQTSDPGEHESPGEYTEPSENDKK